MKEIDRKQGVQSESAILVGVELPEHKGTHDNLNELAGLVETAGAEIVGRLTQKRSTPDQTTYLGKGKVEQLELMIRATDADAVIFDNNLSPAQIRNLESYARHQGAGSHRSDSRYLLDPCANARSPARRRARTA